MGDLTRLRAAYARRNTVFASEGKQVYTNGDFEELRDALVEAGPGLIEAAEELEAAKAVMKAHEAGGTFACDALQFAVGEAQASAENAQLREQLRDRDATIERLRESIRKVTKLERERVLNEIETAMSWHPSAVAADVVMSCIKRIREEAGK